LGRKKKNVQIFSKQRPPERRTGLAVKAVGNGHPTGRPCKTAPSRGGTLPKGWEGVRESSAIPNRTKRGKFGRPNPGCRAAQRRPRRPALFIV